MPSDNTNSLQYFCLEPARFKLDGGAMYGIIPKPLWEKKHPSDEANRVDLALRLWLIKTIDRLIIVDTGIGDYHGEKFDRLFDVRSDKNPLEQALATLGHSCDDITDLVISHLHFDHVGGIGIMEGDSWVPVFKKARCHVHSDHLHYSQNATARDSGSFHTKNFLPIIDYYRQNSMLETYSGQKGELFDLGDGEKLRFICSHGHTPWLMHPYTSEYLYLSDILPTSAHIPIAWVMGYDISPGVSTENKKEFLDFIEKNNLKVIFEHDPLYWGASIEKSEKGYQATKLFDASKSLSYELT